MMIEQSMMISSTKRKTFLLTSLFLFALLLLLGNNCLLTAQSGSSDMARYTPEWIRDGFADAGATHEPWIFHVLVPEK